MYKKGITFFLLISFTMFIVAPTAIMIMDSSYDISFFYSVNEEENKSNETLKKLEFEVFDLYKYVLDGIQPDKTNQSDFYFKNYKSLYLENISPPPEQNDIS